MRKLMMTSASIALIVGVAACSSTPEPEPVVVDEPEVVVVEEPEEVVVVEETLPVVPTGPAEGSLEDFQLNVGDRVYFDLDQYRLSADAQSILRRQAAWLSSYPDVNILVAGNCDERGTREYNLGLGERRGNSVTGLLSAGGARGGQLDVVSYGEERPVCRVSDEDCWWQNRRVEVVYTAR